MLGYGNLVMSRVDLGCISGLGLEKLGPVLLLVHVAWAIRSGLVF